MKKGEKLYEGKAKIIYASSDKFIISKISPKKLKSIFNYSKHFKNVNFIFRRVFK